MDIRANKPVKHGFDHQPGGQDPIPNFGGILEVTDGITVVTPTTEIDFTSGAFVTNLGGGIAGVAVTPYSPPNTTELIAAVATHASPSFVFSNAGGASLFDYSSPSAPTPLVNGEYVVTGSVVSNHVPASGNYTQIVLNFNVLSGAFACGTWVNYNFGAGQVGFGGLAGASYMTTSDFLSLGEAGTDASWDVAVTLLATRIS